MAKSITLEQGLDLFIQSRRTNCTPRTRFNYSYHLTRFFKFLEEQRGITRVDEITTDAIHDFIGGLRESNVSTFSRETLIRNPDTYRGFSNYLVTNRIRTSNADKTTVQAYIDSLRRSEIPPYYVHCPKRYVNVFLRFIAYLKGKMIEPPDVDDQVLVEFVALLNQKKYSQSYVFNHGRDIRAFTNYMVKEKYIKKDLSFVMPVVKHKNQHKLTKDEAKRVYAACDNLRDKLLVALALDTGLRLSEITNLSWENVQLKRYLIEVISGKGEKDRIVGFSDAVALLLKKWQIESLSGDEVPEGPIFRTDEGERMTPRGVSSIYVRLSARTGVHVSSHVLRRTCAHNLDKAGTQLSKIQQQLGHANIQTTRDYIGELEGDDIADTIRATSVVGEIIRDADRKSQCRKSR